MSATPDSDIAQRLIDISYDVRILAIDMKSLFANQRSLIEYLAKGHQTELKYSSREVLNLLDSLRRHQK